MTASEDWRTFTGEPNEFDVDVPLSPASGQLVDLGVIDSVEYRCRRDGEWILAHHEFRRRCEPTLTVDEDGVAYIVAGNYRVEADRGIVDGLEERPGEPELPESDEVGCWILGELAVLRVAPLSEAEPWEAEWPEGAGPLVLVSPGGGLLLEEVVPEVEHGEA